MGLTCVASHVAIRLDVVVVCSPLTRRTACAFRLAYYLDPEIGVTISSELAFDVEDSYECERSRSHFVKIQETSEHRVVRLSQAQVEQANVGSLLKVIVDRRHED